MASMTMSSALVGQRVAVKANAGRKVRNVQVNAMAKQSKPKVLTKASDLRLLGKAVVAAEELGLIGLVESAGPSLSQIEKLGLLSKGEALIYDRGAPGAIFNLGVLAAVAGAGAVYAIPDDSAGLVALQVAIGGACVVAFGAALTGSSLLRKLQN